MYNKKLISKANNLEFDNAVTQIANDLNYSCLYFPAKTKCLEWAMTYLFLALRKKYKCNF